MLTIRKTQIDLLSGISLNSFENRLVAYVKETHSQRIGWLAGEDDLRLLIREGIAKANGYGIERERDVVRFIDLMFEIDPHFDQFARIKWARAILEDKDLSGQTKIALIYPRAVST